jgi:mono/diheme cytochrome c family protein
MSTRTIYTTLITLSLSFGGVGLHAQAPGADTYKAKCQMCHGADGLGTTPAGKAMKAVPFNDPQIVAKSNADLIAATANGKNKMPAFKGKLSDADIKATIVYIRTLQKK